MAFPVFIYEMVIERKKAFVYMLFIIAMAVGSFHLVYHLFPTYFYATLFAHANSFGSWRYMIRQSAAFAKYYWPLILLICYALALKILKPSENNLICKSEAGGNENARSLTLHIQLFWRHPVLRLRSFSNTLAKVLHDSSFIYYLALATATICLIPMGTNDGAWLSYYYQLALPSMIIIGLSALTKLRFKIVAAVAVILIVYVSLFHSGIDFNVLPMMSKRDYASWNRAYAVLEKHKASSVFLSPAFADYIERNKLEIFDNGNIEYYVNLQSDNILTKVIGLLLPNAKEQFERYRSWAEGVSKNVREEKYSIIAVVKNYHPLIRQEDLEENYLKIDEINLKTGGEVFTEEFWTPLFN
jgi:hypothetical protein